MKQCGQSRAMNRLPGGVPARSLAERLDDLSTPEPNSGCILFFGNEGVRGHGRIWQNGRLEQAHRCAWRIVNGRIPRGLLVLHKCDTPCCINPDHLYLGTTQDNSDDMARKGRGRKGYGQLPVGVTRNRRRFQASMKVHGRRLHLGSYATIEAASVAVELKRAEVPFARATSPSEEVP